MKILILRFSSIGDIVLTTPVVRCLKKQINNVEIHYLTKEKYKEILIYNPYISKIHCFKKSINEVEEKLSIENYDIIIDLHNNIRSLILKRKLKIKSYTFPKLNILKWILVNLKINYLPKIHIVDRYFSAVKSLNIQADGNPCDYFLNENVINNLSLPLKYITISVGAQFYTKQIPINKLKEIIDNITDIPIVFLGDNKDFIKGEELIKQSNSQNLINLCGKLSLNDSVKVLKKSKVLLTGDSGLMHIASCFEIPIVSLWGNTVPEFGMFPYNPKNKNSYKIFEVKDLKCRPCSKIGYSNCPKKHFNCMQKQDIQNVVIQIKKFYEFV